MALSALVLGLALAGESAAQPPARDSIGLHAEGLPIAQIEIETRNVYEPLPPGRLRALFRLANRLHVRTRESTVRDELLFEVGDRWSERRARETERALRALHILDPQRIETPRDGDSVRVRVITRDAWTTSPEFNVESGGGETFGSMSLGERNLLGLGKSVEVAYRDDPAGITRSARYLDPNVAGHRMRFVAGATSGSGGVGKVFSLERPFYAEDTRTSFGVSFSRTTSVSRLYELGLQVADFDKRVEDFEAFYGRGWRNDGTVLRFTGGFHARDRSFGPSRIDPGAPPQFDGAEESLRLRRLEAQVRWWRPHFVEKMRIERLDGIEDYDLGPSVTLDAGFAPKALGSVADEGYLRARLDGAVAPHPLIFGLARADVSTRLRGEPLETITEIEARVVSQTVPRNTFVIATHGLAGWRAARDFQGVIGGLNGLRAFPVQALAGQQVWRINAEDRVAIVHDYLNLTSLGFAVFYDAGRAFGPGSAGVGWFHAAGFGLRVSLPRSGLSRVARFDIAFPLSPELGRGREPVFSFGSSQAF